MSKTPIALLYGGRSGEHEVSLRSAASVFGHLNKDRYDIYLIGISRDGIWYLQDPPSLPEKSLTIAEDPARIVSVLPGRGLFCNGPLSAEVVFPVLHGTYGEDGTIQGLFEMADLAYVGAPVGGSYLGMDKDIAKIVWQHHSLPVVPFRTLKKQETEESSFSWEDWTDRVINEFGLPLFIKPSQSGSSVGVSRAADRGDVRTAAEAAFRFDRKILVEPAVEAREIECSVIGNEQPRSYPPGELEPTHDFYDYEAKYIDPDGAGLIIPARLDDKTAQAVRTAAVNAYKALECRGMARVDFFLDKNSGEFFLNEINTIPGFTNISMFALMCESGGLGYADLLDTLIQYALEEHENRSQLCFSLS